MIWMMRKTIPITKNNIICLLIHSLAPSLSEKNAAKQEVTSSWTYMGINANIIIYVPFG